MVIKLFLIKYFTLFTLTQFTFGNSPALEPMVIVEKREEQKLSQTSPWVEYISMKEWKDRQIDDVSEILRGVPGMLIVRSGQRGAQVSLYSRGAQSDHTIFLLDGRKLNGGFSGLYNLGQLGLGGYSSVELMRGPSTFQYGSEGLGGAVMFRSLGFQGSPEKIGEFVVQTGSFDSLSSSLNRNFVGKDWQMGFSSRISTTENDRPNSAFESSGGTFSFRKRIKDGLELDFIGSGFASEAELPGPIYSSSNIDYQDSYNYLLSPGLSLKEDDWSIDAHYSYAVDWIDSFSGGIWGTYQTVGKSIQHQAELIYRRKLFDSLKWKSGFTHLSQKFAMSEDAEVDALRDSQAIWGELGWMPIEPLEINAGVRLENHSDYDFPVTGSLSAKWMYSELFALHGRLTNGFSPPTGNDLYFPGSGNLNLNPESARNLEAGISLGNLASRYYGKVTFFKSEIDDLIEFGMPNRNLGSVEISGMELSFSVNITSSLRGFLGLTLLDPKNVRTGENFLDRRPKNSGSFRIEWYGDDTIVGFDSSIRRKMMERDFSAWPASWIESDNYLVSRIYASKFIGREWRLFGKIENLFDESYDEVHGYPALGRNFNIGLRYFF